MSRHLYLGVCIFAPKPFTRVQALARAEQGAWRIYDFTQTLPPEGRAFAPSLGGRDARSYLAFRVIPNERNDANRDQFLVDDPEPLAEVLDYRKRDPELARRALVEEGVVSLLPGTDNVVVALPDGLCTVIRMAKDPLSGRFIAQSHGLDHLPTFTFDERLFSGDEIDGRWIAVPSVTVGAKAGSINWCSDADFLEWVLKRLVKVSRGSPISRNQASAVVRYLSDAHLLPSQGEELAQSIARFRKLAQHLTMNQTALDEMVATLSTLEHVDFGLRAQREEVRRGLRDELEPQVRAELEKGMGDLAARRAELLDEIDRAEAQVTSAKARAEQAGTAARALEEALTDELARLGEVLDVSDIQVSSDSTSLVRRVASRLSQVGHAVDLTPSPVPPWSRPLPMIGEPSPWSDAGAILERAAERWGYVGKELRLADMFARARQILLLPQDAAQPFLRSYAWAVAGGALTVEGLHPAAIALDDLWRQPTSGEPTGFARAWTAARRNPRQFRLVLLDGLHSSPHDFWAAGLQGLLNDQQRPTNLLVFASIGPAFIDRERVWTQLAQAFVPFAPSSSRGATSEALDRASGRARAATWLDATAAPRPEPQEIVAQLERLSDERDTERVARHLAVFAAGRAIEGAEAMDALAAKLLASEKPEPLGRGDNWLRDTLVAGNN